MYWYMANCGKNVIVFVLLCTCIWGIYISVDMIFQSLWFLSWFPFLDRGLLRTKKILNNGFLMVMLKSFYNCHHGLVNRYRIYVSQMSTAMLCFSLFPLSWLYLLVCNKSNTMGATSGSETGHPSGAPEFHPRTY